MTADAQTDDMLREARRLADAGRIPEAIACYQHVLARRPELPNAWYNLALIQRKAGRPAAALASYQQALAHGVARPEEVHLNRAVVFSDDLRQPDAAERELVAALGLNPSYLPALLNLANLQEDLGRRDAARQTYEQMLALNPRSTTALARYANLTRFTVLDDPLIGRLRDAINDSSATDADRAVLGFALGRALDNCGEYGEAFSAYTAANASSRASAGGITYDRAGWERMVDRLITAFPTAPANGGGEPPAGAPRPIFICGLFRSGSTLVEQLLAGHPRVTPGGQLELIPRLAPSILTSFPDTIAAAPANLLTEAALYYRQALSGLFPGAEVVTDKRPDNFTLIGLIKYLLPDAKIVHTERDALDNCLSIFFLHLDHRMSYALDLMDIGHYYRHYLRLMAHWKRLFGPDILDVRYDVLVRDPRQVMEPLLKFLGLDWDEKCLEVTPGARAVKTANPGQARERLYQSSSGHARHYAEQLAPLLAVFGNLSRNGLG